MIMIVAVAAAAAAAAVAAAAAAAAAVAVVRFTAVAAAPGAAAPGTTANNNCNDTIETAPYPSHCYFGFGRGTKSTGSRRRAARCGWGGKALARFFTLRALRLQTS